MVSSGNRPNHILVPDSAFVSSFGYQSLKATIEQNWTAWQERNPTAYWRGALTGVARNFEEILELPRVRLAELGNQLPYLDAKIVDIAQYVPGFPELHAILNQRNTMGPRENEINNLRYKVVIDIDGNSNSWPGLMLKLLSGSPVIKLKSDYRQWYYHRLVDRENIILIDSLEKDLPGAIEMLLGDPQLAQYIGRNGRALALSMSLESEHASFVEGWNRAVEASN